MPVYNNNKIELLNALQAYRRGYFTKCEYVLTDTWIRSKLEDRQNKKLVYINGIYRGIITGKMKLFDVVEKYKEFL